MKLLQIALSLLLVLSPIACASLNEIRKECTQNNPSRSEGSTDRFIFQYRKQICGFQSKTSREI